MFIPTHWKQEKQTSVFEIQVVNQDNTITEHERSKRI